MKTLKRIIVVALSVLMLASCGSAGNALSSAGAIASIFNSGAKSGEKAGAALRALYEQFKKDGKLSLTNTSNLNNISTLAKTIESLKGQEISSTFCKGFAQGLVGGSDKAISSKVSSTVTSALLNIASNVDLSSVVKAADAAASGNTIASAASIAGVLASVGNTSEITNSLNSILKMMGN